MKVKMNMCVIDRSLRVALSLALIYFGFINTEVIGNIAINFLIGGFGILNLISALIGFCPVYFVAHISSLRDTESPHN